MKEDTQPPFTPLGILVFLISSGIFGFGLVFLFTDIFTTLPPGSYPLFIFLLPLIALSLGIFFGINHICRKKGFPLLMKDKMQEENTTDDTNQ